MMKTWSVVLLCICVWSMIGCAPVQAAPEPVRAPTATAIPQGSRPIYVIDPNNGAMTSTIWTIDPDSQRVVGGIGTRHTPEIAVSPDGARLYVADSYLSRVIRGEPHDVLSVYDTATGQLVHDDINIQGRLLYKLFPNPQPFTFLSRDGKRMFVGKYGDPDIHALRMTVLDAETFKTLAEYSHPNCGLMPLRDGRMLCISYDVRLQFVEPLTGQTEAISLPPPTRAVSPSQPNAWVLSSADRLYLLKFDAGTQAHVRVIDLAKSPPQIVADQVALDVPTNSFAGSDRVLIAPDESRLYLIVLVGEKIDQNTPTEIWAYDTRTWARVGVFNPSDPAWHIAISNDGTQLYTVNPFKKSLSIFDTTTFKEIGTLHDLGDTPAFIVVPPR